MRCPFAIWKPLPENETAADIDPRVAITHTAVSNALSLFGYFNQPGVNLETHFYIRNDGLIEQYLDTEKQADGNRYANPFAVSIEHQDNAAKPIVPMTDAQIYSNIRLNRWLSDVHPKIKRQRCDKWNGSGYGYHTMWGAPGPWTPVAKDCPGPARIKQFEQIILPALINPVPPVEEEFMDLAGSPPWVQRQPNARFPVFVCHPEPQSNSIVIFSRDNAAFGPTTWKEGRRSSSSEDGQFNGLWFRRFFNTGLFYGFGYSENDGVFYAIAQNGTYDLAKR